MSINPIPLEDGYYYHIFNRGNNRENIFAQERNYSYFMELWWKHTFQIADTLAFCLLRNHFHAAIFVKHIEDLSNIKLKKPSQYFSNFFIAYARGVNNATGRTGALFERPFERVLITDERYLMRLIIYIHQNPQKHQFVTDFRDWSYSSYHELLGTQDTRLNREKVMELFGGRDGVKRFHKENKPQLDLDYGES